MRTRNRSNSRRWRKKSASEKANQMLNGILIALTLIVLRIWHLSVIEYEERVEAAERPQIRELLIPAKRGTIRDRFNEPLALNRIQYNAAILYSQIQQIPSLKWEYDQDGKRIKQYKRRVHIAKLAALLAKELDLDEERIEDLIHAKGALYHQIPFVIKENISEKQYYRLRALEREWVGLHTERVPRRVYPKGRVGSDILGYIGAISREKYENIIGEIKTLRAFFTEWEEGGTPPLPEGFNEVETAYNRLKELEERAYSIHDKVGKMGIEGAFEEELRGFHGKERYFSNARGNFLHRLEGSYPAQSGTRLLLTISAELQEYAEKLLIENEAFRTPHVGQAKGKGASAIPSRAPWIKGGAIVAMDPQNGDILALASCPRYDPNDFVAERGDAKIHRWFETESYLSSVWDQRRPLEREVVDQKSGEVIEEALWLSWDHYLSMLLPADNPVYKALGRIDHVEQALTICQAIEQLRELCGNGECCTLFNQIWKDPPHQTDQHPVRAAIREEIEERVKQRNEEVTEIKRVLTPFFAGLPHNRDKILFIDLLRLIVDNGRFPEKLPASIQNRSLSFYREASCELSSLQEETYTETKKGFHLSYFQPWRRENEQPFLKRKRQEEKAAGRRFPKPYIDLLDAEEKSQFAQFWEENSWQLQLALLMRRGNYAHLREIVDGLSNQEAILCLKTLRPFAALDRPLLGRYPNKLKNEQDLALAFYPRYGYGYGRSFAFRQATTPGSLFKLVTAYCFLLQCEEKGENMNPLTITDAIYRREGTLYLGYREDGQPIPQLYKGGRLIKSHSNHLGKVDLLRAIEVSSNPYFSILASEYIDHPEDLIRAAADLSYGEKTGIDLPAEIGGSLPNDLCCSRSALYATAIGQHSLVTTPLQSAVMLAAIANGGEVVKPKIVALKAGYNHQEKRLAVVQLPKEVRRQLLLPEAARTTLLNGMQRATAHIESRLFSLKLLYGANSPLITDFLSLKEALIGKSGTTESVERLSLDREFSALCFHHISFGGILFDRSSSAVLRDAYGKPELVVTVYLRYGDWGKDAAPVAAAVAKKWREIKAKERSKSPLANAK